jgi:hypothetical protein
MRRRDRPPTQGSFGSRGIGDRWDTITSGFEATGNIHLLRGRIGRIHTTITIAKAGNTTKVIGTTRTTTTGIGVTGIMGGVIAITTTMTTIVRIKRMAWRTGGIQHGLPTWE